MSDCSGVQLLLTIQSGYSGTDLQTNTNTELLHCKTKREQFWNSNQVLFQLSVFLSPGNIKNCDFKVLKLNIRICI